MPLFSGPVPAARGNEHFSATEVGGDIVLFDNERLVYHTLNSSAFAVWQLCDGTRTADAIVQAVSTTSIPLTKEAVELAILDLADAGLLETSSPVETRMHRRRLLKLAAAGLGTLPLVHSITAPSSVSAQTYCTTVWQSPGTCDPALNQGGEWNQVCTTLCANAGLPPGGCDSSTRYCGRCVTWGTPLPPSGGCCDCSCNSMCPFMP